MISSAVISVNQNDLQKASVLKKLSAYGIIYYNGIYAYFYIKRR